MTGSIKYVRQEKVNGPSVLDSVSVSLIGRWKHRETSLFFCIHIRLDRPERIRSGPRDQDENRTVKRVEHVKQEKILFLIPYLSLSENTLSYS